MDWGIVVWLLEWAGIATSGVLVVLAVVLWATLLCPDRWLPDRIKNGKDGPYGSAARSEKASAKKLKRFASVTPKDEVVLGWRGYSFGWNREGDPADLLQGMAGAVWTGRTHKASCWAAGGVSLQLTKADEDRCEMHLAEGRCTCGIYGLKEEHSSQLEFSQVRALCAFWGWIVPAEFGFRAQYARIEKLFFECRCGVQPCSCQVRPRRIAEYYEVPFEVTPSKLKRMVVPIQMWRHKNYMNLVNFLPAGASPVRISQLPASFEVEIIYKEAVTWPTLAKKVHP